MRNTRVFILAIALTLTFGGALSSCKNKSAVDTAPSTTAPAASTTAAPAATSSILPSPGASPMTSASPTTAADLTIDAQGLSKAEAVITTEKGVIKFRFYPKDAPNTVNRIVELMQKGFYNGIIFHRVVPGFVIQGGDPGGTGAGGSGQKLKAEFNERRHVEGTVAMARTQDPNSADSQFYISLGTHPHLDRSYTVFGQVVEGMDVVRKIQPGDKMTTVTVVNQ